MINIEHLYKSYQTPEGPLVALHDINLTVNRGEIFGIIGKSGAGKSTLLRCVNLLERPTQGKVIVDGANLLALSEKALRASRRKIGMIFQHFNLLSSRTVYENIALPLEFMHSSKSTLDEIILPLLELTGLSDKKNVYPAQLSGGQKQRVAIARALTSQPKVLLCDEATSALDPETTQSILQLLVNIRDRLGLTILLITHEMGVIKGCCDKVGVLEQGHLLEQNEVGQFFAYPETEAAKNFVYNALQQPLPIALQQHVLTVESANTHPLIRLWFKPDTATQPIIAQLINQFGLRVNILQGNLEYIKKHATGMLVIALAGEKTNLHAGMQHLQTIGVNIEILGHVPNDIISFA